MKPFKKVKPNDWQYPSIRVYKMQCCDCGLVHNMEFKVVRVTKKTKNGYFTIDDVDDPFLRVAIRAKRNERLTIAAREQRQKK
jgi:hypothetical protein